LAKWIIDTNSRTQAHQVFVGAVTNLAEALNVLPTRFPTLEKAIV
jgi:hypothetical protein